MRENSVQINRACYARGRPRARVPQTINESGHEQNFTEENTAEDLRRINPQQFTQRPLQRRFYSESDVRTPGRTDTNVSVPVNHVAIDMDFDDSTDDHINAITSGYGSNWTIADP